MAIAEHRQAVRAAERTGRELRVLFGRLGTTEHPRGAVLSAYRNARGALRDVLRRRSRMMAVEGTQVLAGLRETVDSVAMGMLLQAGQIGAEQAQVELEAYGGDHGVWSPYVGEIQAAHAAWMGPVDAQIAGARAALMMGWDEAMVTGDEERVGLLNPAVVVREGARWLAIAALAAWLAQVDARQERLGTPFDRQAIAAIDERTTDCCLRVHGQVVGLRADFLLTGTPRFADKLRDPPFHWWCRTSVCLVRPEDADDQLSQAMREAARAELEARAEAQRHIEEIKAELARVGAAQDVRARKGDSPYITGLRNDLRMWRARERVEIHPASATSRR